MHLASPIRRLFRRGACPALGLALALLFVLAIRASADETAIANIQFFRDKIEPVLKTHCYQCHSAQADDLQASLLLDTRAGVLRGGDSGPAVVVGKPGESLLIQAIRHEGDYAMPPEKPKLPTGVIADFVKWVELGLPDPRVGDSLVESPAWKEARTHWAFQPVRKAAIPAVHGKTWPATAIDTFILAKLEERGWSPAPPASRGVWLRRVTFDLAGLPPTPEEIAQFAQDKSPDANERAVDRLLASPRYGERWGQHWLDVVRYAESEGYEYDRHLPDAWRYRDYVVASLNADKPFDRFVIEQIAGDEIDPADPELATAAVFHRLGPVRRNAGNPEIALSRNEVLTERTDILGTALLGLTVGCARCHNHKLEPILQRDYYRLQAYLAATDEHNIVLASAAEQQAWEAKTAEIKGKVSELQKLARGAIGAERAKLDVQIADLEDQLPAPLATIPSTWNDFGKRTQVHVLRRGVWENKGDKVGPRPLSVLVPEALPELPPDASEPRTHLADWLASAENPLTARVIVNRLWQGHFGLGIVKTANDFGTHGEKPSHPELLDWLAATLVERDWSLKDLHRVMVTSSAYRMSSAASSFRNPQSAIRISSADPENRLLSHFPRRRLAAEELRDAMLAASGRLNLRAGGQSVMTPVEPDLVKLLYKPSQWQVAADPAEHDRRSIYLLAKRNLRLPFLETFDGPPLLSSCARRESSTHAPQALELLNGRLSNDLAAAFADRLQRESGGDPNQIVERAFWLAAGRGPTAKEREVSLAFLQKEPLDEFALAMFNLNGFLYVD